jgi:hypothetical protein
VSLKCFDLFRFFGVGSLVRLLLLRSRCERCLCWLFGIGGLLLGHSTGFAVASVLEAYCKNEYQDYCTGKQESDK